MKKCLYATLVSTLFCLFSCEETRDPNALYNEAFGWEITIPENFKQVSEEEWAKVQNKSNTPTKDGASPSSIFVLRSGDYNYLESNHQAFDPEIDGDYLSSCKNVNQILYETFENQMPDVQIDSASSTEVIDDLTFQAFKINIQFKNGVVLHSNIYNRLFDDREFSVNIMYIDELEGKKMLNAWKNSTFD